MGESVRFGAFRLDLGRLCLFGPAGPIELRPKSFEVLRYLVDHAERVVRKDELIKAVWPTVIVTEDSLTRCVSEVRRAIGDDAQVLIKTIPRRGYLLDVPVASADAEPARPPQELQKAACPEPQTTVAATLIETVGGAGGRKQATVLYVDIGSFLGPTTARNAEDALNMCEAMLAAVIGSIQRYGGTVTSVTSESVVGLFGAPVALEDHAVRACHAALDVQGAVQRSVLGIAEVPPQAGGISIGLAAGEIITRPLAGLRERVELAVVGPAVGQASRLGQTASGLILITPDVSRLAQGYIQVRSCCPDITQAFGGFVVELIGMAAAQTRFQALAARGLSPFVGRIAELASMEQAAAKVRQGRGQVVAVIGDPGVGKSRLVYEFLRQAHDSSWRALVAGTISSRAPTSYQPVADLLKGYFQIDGRDDAVVRRAKIVTRLRALDSSCTADLASYLTIIDEPVDDTQWQALDPSTRRERMLEAVKRLLLLESCNQPIILVLEDMHWIDSETEAFLDALVDSVALARVLIVVTYRPIYRHRWGGQSFYTQVRLDELAPGHSRELLLHLVGSDPSLASFTDHLQRQGNPLFLEESVRSLAEDRVLEGERGSYRLSRPLSDLQVPAAIQAILAARIDHLAPGEKHLLQAAAVIGKECAISILRRIANLPSAEFEQGLAGLRSAELLLQTDFSADPTLTFKHALTHEVAYASLLAGERRQFHRAIVDAIEKVSSDPRLEYVEQLAHHAVRANLGEKAVYYLGGAGAKAFARSSNREAVAHYEQALTILATLPQTRETQAQAIDIRCELRSALYPLAEYRMIEQYLLEAENLARTLADERRLGWVSAYMSSLYLTVGGHAAAAHGLAEGARTIADAVGDSKLQVAAQYYIAWANYISGDYFGTERMCRAMINSLQGNRTSERFGVVIPAVQARAYLARALAERGEFAEASVHGLEAVQLAQQFDHPFSLAWAGLGLGYVKRLQGELGEAAELLERALAQCRRWSIGVQAPLVMALLGHVYARSGRVEQGLTLLQAAVRDYETTATEHFLSISLTQVGEAYLAAGQPDKAREFADRAVLMAGRRGERGFEAWALRLVGEVASHRDGPGGPTTIMHYRRALACANRLGMRPLAAHCNLALGKHLQCIGQLRPADKYLAAAATLYRIMSMPVQLQEAETERIRLGPARDVR